MKYGFSPQSVEISSKKELNKIVSDEQIYHHYLGDFVVDSYMFSPRGESDPSFKIDWYDGQLMWRDFGNDRRPADAINLVQYLERLQGRHLNYYQAMEKIIQDVDRNTPYMIDYEKIEKQQKDIRAKYRKTFQPFEQAYWKSQNLSKRTIRRFDVFPGEIWCNDRIWYYSRPGDPVFIYLWDLMGGIFKGYRPLANNHRFIESEGCENILQGEKYLVPQDTLIITKSYKDVMTYFELGHLAVAPQSETLFVSEEKLNKLKHQYKNIFINYDPDDAGMRSMIPFSEEYGLPYFHFGDEGFKDVTELRIGKGDKYTKQCIDFHMT